MSASARAIFLSYASQDVEAARHICDALRAAGLDVWFDQSELRGGEAWDASIRRQIKECALFMPVISANTQAREEGYFRLEWKLAVDRSHFIADDKPFLLPVVIDATLDVIARVPEKFREVQWTRLPAGETPEAFAEQVQRLLSGGAVPSHRTSTAAPAMATPSHVAPSIAVLPFVNRSHDVEDEYFSDGLADELLNVLAKIRGLRVAARSSAYTFKGKGASIAEVGRALHVATVLEGSVRKVGNRLRISVQLVKVADGYHLWSETYDRTLEDIFAVQDDIAQSVVKELRITLMGETVDAKAATEVKAQMAAATRGRATDPEVHRLYLHARYLIDRLTRDDTTKGIGYLKLALERDPTFALAWAELGEAYAAEANSGWAPVVEGYQRAREAVAHALSLAPDLAEAHAELGWIQMSHDWDWRGAQASYRRALELAPGDATVLRRAAMLALNLGRVDEAVGLYRRAVEQDPLSSAAYANFGDALGAAGSLGEAELGYRKALELAPQRAVTRAHLALNLWAQGRDEAALAEALGATDDIWRNYALAIIHRGAGRHSETETALRDLIAKYAESAAYQIAEVHAARGETDHAFAWLERAYTQRDLGLSQMKTRPLLHSLHADPRWDAFLRKMGLAD
jgi:TolB-like protein/Tfp pilus assembly protein PilF